MGSNALRVLKEEAQNLKQITGISKIKLK